MDILYFVLVVGALIAGYELYSHLKAKKKSTGTGSASVVHVPTTPIKDRNPLDVKVPKGTEKQ
jgi:hypothetical protein